METRLKILHIDDNRDDAYLIGLHLRSLDPDLVFVATPEEYERALVETKPDVILSDFRMPGYDGDDSFKAARAVHPTVPFILVTGELGEEFVIERLRNGVTDYVLKDNLKRLVPVIERAVKETVERERWARIADKFTMAIETASEGVWLIDPHGVVITANDQMAKLLGLDSAAELIGHFAFDYIPPADLPPMQSAFGKQIHGEALRFDSRLRRRDGAIISVSVSSRSEIGESGEVVSILSMFTDTSDRVAAKAFESSTKARLEYFTKRSPIGVLFFDLGGDVQYCSESAAALLGLQSVPASGTGLTQAGCPAETALQWNAVVSGVFASGVPADLQSVVFVGGAPRTLSVHFNREGGAAGDEPQVAALVTDVTEVSSRLSKAESEASMLRSIVGSITDGFLAFDETFVVTYINERAARQGNATPEQLLGKNFFEAYPSLRGRTLQQELALAMKFRQPREFELEGIVQDVQYMVHAYPTKEGVAVYWEDITDRKRAEAALKLSEEKFRMLFESMTEGFVVFEHLPGSEGTPEDFRILEANPAIESQTGHKLKRSEVVGKRLREAVPGVEPAWMEMFAGVAATGTSANIEQYSNVFESWYGLYAFSPRAGQVALIFTNITARKTVEAALRSSEERLALAQEAAKIGVFDWEMERSSMLWTPELEEIFGLRRGSFIQKYEGWASRVHPDDLPGIETMFQDWMDSGRADAEWEYRILREEGDGRMSGSHIKEERWVSSRGRILRDTQGKALRMIGTVVDITAAKEAELNIQRLNAELETRVADRTAELQATVKELETFTSALGHDLKAPLRAIHGFVRLALERPAAQGDPELEGFLRMAIQNSTGASRLMDELLGFMKLGREELIPVNVDMVRLVGDVVQQLKATEPADRRLEVMVADLPQIACNETLIRQVWTNLIANSLKFTRAMPVARIEISAALRKDHYTFSVCDNGVGFDHENAKKLFGVFQRLHMEDDFEGSGIGLASVKRIIERHGGKVWADGETGKGACFYFTLPIRMAPAPDATVSEQEHEEQLVPG